MFIFFTSFFSIFKTSHSFFFHKNDRVLLLVRENTKLVKSRAELQQAASDAVEIAMKASDAAKQLGKKYSKAEKERSEMNTLNKEVRLYMDTIY